MLFVQFALLGLALAATGLAAGKSSDLEEGFRNPPEAARPWVYWFIMDGNLSREGITADFEALKRAGIGGVIMMEVDVGIPRGPVKFMSAEWRALFKHAVAEAERLGLQITLNAGPGWTGSGGPWVKPEQSMQHLVASAVEVAGPKQFDEALPQPQRRPAFFGDGQLPPELEKAKNDYYRDVLVLAFPTPAGNQRIRDIDEKALYVRAPFTSQPGVKSRLPSAGSYPALPAEAVVAADRVVDITAKMDANGRVAWAVPAGEWTIMRFGRTSNGAGTRPAPLPGLGLECDKCDKAALDAHFDAFIGALLREIGPRKESGGAGWTMLHIDSWEMGAQNWTGAFREEFRRRRGYDSLHYLPAITGRVVDSMEVSERFLWDLRQTAQELIIENHAEHLKALGRQHGLGLSIEPYDMMPCADMSIGAVADVPMCEFWLYGFDSSFSVIEAASIAHTCGRPIVAAESFTSGDDERWQAHPGTMKVLGDWAFSAGVNRFVVHRSQHQPWLDRKPGMTMGPYGVHWERTQTWWDMAGAYHDYLARCQFVLRQGLPVADVCFLVPEGSPQVFRPPASATRGSPPERLGYNFDGCAPETLVSRMSVKDGRLVLPDGMSYRVLVLPEVPTMTPTLLRKIRELVKAGATVLGPPPVKSPSLSGYPQCDAAVKRLAGEMWGSDGRNGKKGSDGRKGGGSKPVIPHASTQIPVGSVIWDEAFKSPVTNFADKSPLSDARWIWYNEGQPVVSAPVGKRYFRKSFTLEGNSSMESARIAMTADNSFEVWVNGERAGEGNNFHLVATLDVRQMLRPGVNVLAVTAENGGTAPNPAGLIGALVVRRFKDGQTLTVQTDQSWQATQTTQGNWTTSTTAEGDWSTAIELGQAGIAPWGALEKPAAEPDVYCNFGVVSNLLGRLGVQPDFESDGPLRYAHRRTGEAEIYFVANREDRPVNASCTFRVFGKAPELWDPLTGQTRRLPEFSSRDGRTTVPMRFEAAQSFFVVFRKHSNRTVGKEAIAIPPVRSSEDGSLPLTPALSLGEREKGTPAHDLTEHARSADTRLEVGPLAKGEGRGEGEGHSRNFLEANKVAELKGSWEVSFEPKWGGPERVTFDALEDWSKRKEDGIKFYSGTAVYRKTFDAPKAPQRQRMYLDLGVVKNLARVRLNGQDLGVVWCAPWRVEITKAVRPKGNQLEIAVANLWPNRLIGDQALPPEKRLTSTTWNPFAKDSPRLESGLLGPVTLATESKEAVGLPTEARGPARTAGPAGNTLLHEATHRLVTMSDRGSNLVLRLNYNDGCWLDQVKVLGREVIAPEGVSSAIRVSNQWFTTRSGLTTPKVTIAGDTVTVSDITFGGAGIRVKESWKFTLEADRILWEIGRSYGTNGWFEDAPIPAWNFQSLDTWTGGLLDNGGVAWNKYLETTNATYVAHSGAVTFWNRDEDDCLRVKLSHPPYANLLPDHWAMRFSHQPSGAETVAFSVTARELGPKHELRRYDPSRQDLWAPFEVRPSGPTSVSYSLQAQDYKATCSRGVFPGLNGRSIHELLNTIARYGVIDRRILGANGWRTGYTCLHEQWFSQMGIAIDDPAYLANCAATYDFERDHAMEPSGRVKSRWCYDAGDAMPGTYDTNGFYEAQWGYLLDSQPAYVICVAELFDQTGDRAWLRGQKAACERALDYLLRRDADGDGLVEMMTDFHTEQRGSDWIDIIWAAHENALVNAELYYALTSWAAAAELLNDPDRGAEYRRCAAKLKTSYNQTTAEGGFWDPQNQWYVYWRDKDGSVHGNNLVTPVNFAAIGYGLCDDAGRREAILGRMEHEMQQERLFFWPLNFYPYQPGEGHANNFPFPNYENGDIFLSWGELAVRAYARSNPAIAVKYIKNVLEKYELDGLSYQRYQRQSQRGAGEDILAGNGMTLVGLYRDIYGIQPRHNRLYLEPHLTPELSGTQLRYQLRNQTYLIELTTEGSRMAVDDFAVRAAGPFALNVQGDTAEVFPGNLSGPALSLTRSRRAPVAIAIDDRLTGLGWGREWIESCAVRGVVVRHVVAHLEPRAVYELRREGKKAGRFKADREGKIEFKATFDAAGPERFELLIQSR